MNDYIELRIDITPDQASDNIEMSTLTDVMAAMLCEIGFESFVPDENGLTAYIRQTDFNDDNLKNVINQFPFEGCELVAQTTLVEGQDWNHEWEKNYFNPIVVGNDCVIHSSFHTDFPQCKYDITIDPKMAFGTGHHATTSSIIERLLTMDLVGKSVIDMGTGTGILAILAAMRGASPVTAIEIDEAAMLNARDNVASNGHPEIDVLLGEAALLENRRTDIFIANINRNIITQDLAAYAATLPAGGIMLLSGFYESDIPVVMAVAQKLQLVETVHTVKGDNWTCLQLLKL